MTPPPPRARPSGTSPLARPLTPSVETPIVGDGPTGPADSRTPEVPRSRTPEVRKSGTPEVGLPESGSPEVPESGGPVPRYRQLDRVDALLRPDQVRELTELRKRLSRRRTDRGERLTNNTMIRLAVDMLIGEAKRNGIMPGNTEDELRANLGVRLDGPQGWRGDPLG